MTLKEFERQFRMLYLPLGMFALRIVDDADDAEDLVQSAFVKVWEKISTGDEIRNFRAFIYQCVRNECLLFLSRKKDMVDIESIPDVSDETLDTSVRDAEIWKAIDGLPNRCRDIFLMSKRDGMTNEEIANELGLSVKTVKNQMTKAFARLRDCLASGHKPFYLPFL